MKKLLLLTVMALALFPLGGCGGITPYDAARMGLSLNPTAKSYAQARFDRWSARQTDPEVKAKGEKDFKAALLAYDDGIKVIKAGIDTAEAAGDKVDIKKLFEEVAKLVDALLKFSLSLEDAITGQPPATPPSAGLRQQLIEQDVNRLLLASL
jgi:hypothetical protein